ncbi:MAG: TrkH family potassium uptake protein [Clostridia bacterium]|nr:TrkH family potassium uptake protein [Clostridia bacterium]
MNYRMVFLFIGRILVTLAALMLVPLTCAIIYGEALAPYLIPIAICLAIGLIFNIKAPKDRRFLPRDGFVCVGISWIVMSLFGCLPYIISGAIPSFVDAFFESVSGFSTTGASILSDVEALPRGLKLWRCFTQWIGGMGVLVFMMAIMPSADKGGASFTHLMKAEVPGPTVDKVVPRVADTARIMYGIYILLTALEFLFLLAGEMNIYEALCHSASTAGTGGFGIMNDSIASYSTYSQYVIAIFMLLFGTNFNVFFLILTGRFLRAIKCEELWWYLGIVAASVTVITLSVFRFFGAGATLLQGEEAFRLALFQVASIISTTGFSTTDYSIWPILTHVVIITLTFSGACAGCTAGGIKISRLLLLAKNGRREIRYILHPRAVMSVKLEGKKVDHEVIRGTTSFIITYASLFLASTFLVTALDGCDLVTGFTSVATCLNNVGPGLGEVGPAGNFGGFTAISKLLLCLDMLLGRLEIFPILILFSPSTWKRYI